MMKNKYFQIFLWCMTFILVGMIILLPQTVPIHWNMNGDIDHYASRYVCIILMLAPILIYYGMEFTRKVDPNQNKIKKRILTYELMKRIMALLFIVFDVSYYYMILIEDAHIQVVMCLILGLFMITIGNYMPKVPQNYFLGIRTPWTLKNEIVWKRTHKAGGYAFIVFGIAIILTGFFGEFGFYFIIFLSIIFVVYLYIYSYFIYKEVLEK